METVRHGMFFAHQGWYPGEPKTCRQQIDRFVAGGRGREGEGDLPDTLPGRAGVVPHAGWVFSGALAAAVFNALARNAGPVDAVVLLGGHLGERSPGWVLTTGAWPTPFGDVEVDAELAEALAAHTRLPEVGPAGYEPDNTIELQLPFIKALLPDARLVAAGVPASPSAEDVGRLAVEAARRLGRQALVVGSTDLTHYGPSYGFEPAGRGRAGLAWVKEENDRRAMELMIALDAETLRQEALEAHFCCCPGAAAAALGAAKASGARGGHLLASLTSFDVRPGESFVGYAALVF